jgi:hypothetical protein
MLLILRVMLIIYQLPEINLQPSLSINKAWYYFVFHYYIIVPFLSMQQEYCENSHKEIRNTTEVCLPLVITQELLLSFWIGKADSAFLSLY